MVNIPPNSRLLFIGDSITDCGRKRPVGDGSSRQALGDGYVSLVDAALKKGYPDHGIHITNMGVAGDTVRDLAARWQRDVLDLQPDWLVVMIGINDVWRHFGTPWDLEWLISLDEYSRTLEALLRQAKPSLGGLTVMTPYLLERDRTDPMRSLMDDFGSAAKEVAANLGAVQVDTQAAFDRLLRNMSPSRLALDRIHVNDEGHQILAQAFLDSIAFTKENS